MTLRSPVPLFAALTACALLGACAGAPRAPISSAAGLGSGEAIVVGRVELVPPLRKDEQKIKVLNSGSFENRLFLITDEKYRRLTQEPAVGDYSGRIEATLGETFFVRSSAKPFYILGGMMYLEIGRTMDRAYFPGSLKVTINPGDKAVYVGTLQYHRNEFFEITKVSVVDDYDRTHADFKKKFGTTYPLRKALLAPVK